MTQSPRSALAEISRFLGSAISVDLQQVRDWMSEDDDEVLSALYVALKKHSNRIVPRPQPMLIVEVLLRIMRVSDVRPGPRDLSLSPYDAARCLLDEALAWDAQRIGNHSGADVLSSLRDRLASEYQSGDERLRRRIVDGFLEHAFETPSLRSLFANWQRSPTLAQAYSEAAQWADSREP